MKRSLAVGALWALLVLLATPALFVAVSHTVGRERARQDPARCTPSSDPASRRWVPADVVARPEFQQGIRECIERRREERWGPSDAWGPLRNED